MLGRRASMLARSSLGGALRPGAIMLVPGEASPGCGGGSDVGKFVIRGSSAGYGCGGMLGGPLVAKGSGWACCLTRRACSTTSDGLIDCGAYPEIISLPEGLSENQLVLIQMLDCARREHREGYLEVLREQLKISDELNKIMALDRDVLTDSARKVGVMIWKMFLYLGGGLVFFGKKADCTSGGAAPSTPAAQ